MMVFCTLFDSNYLDKGLVMYRSLLKVCLEFKIYILTMDDKCREILENYNYENVICISLDSFCNEMSLNDLKKNRKHSEFCWTCTSFLIEYVLKNYEDICTYIDSDLYFYKNPKCLIDEMKEKSVQIIEHRFNNSIEGKMAKKYSGKYCVEFNTFKKQKKALSMLKWWEEKCYETCATEDYSGRIFGDQKYLEEWGNDSDVSVIENLGAGVAPWNVSQYKLIAQIGSNYRLCPKKGKKEFDLVFYHFHKIEYIDNNKVKVPIYHYYWQIDDNLINALYIPYLRELNNVKEELLEKYGFFPIIYTHPAFKENLNKKKGIKYYIYKFYNMGILYSLYGIYAKFSVFLRGEYQGEKDYITF